MSTRCNIGYEMKNGNIRHIYSHWDGYPEGVGKTLNQHYNEYGKIRELIDLGDVSILRANIGEKHSFDNDYELANKNQWTTAYGRDRGEPDTKAEVSKNEDSYIRKAKDSGAEYVYLFLSTEFPKGEWYVADIYGGGGFKELGKVLGHEPVEDENEIHGEGNPFAEKILKYKAGVLKEDQMADTSTAQKIQREAKKTALRLYKQVYDNLFMVSQALLEIPKEYVDAELFGESGPFQQVYSKVKETLDSMTKVSAPEAMTPEEIMPEEGGDELQSEVPVGGDEDLEPVSIE